MLKVVILFVCLQINSTLIVITNSEQKHEEGATIEVENIYHKPRNRSEEGNMFYKKVESFQNYTLDEKCEQGLEMGIGYQVYAPYVNIGGKDFWSTYILSGIIPHIVKSLMKSCCHNRTKITYAHIFDSIYDIEENFNGDNDIDVYFPVSGVDGRLSTEFKGNPFLPIVTAPKIILLVPDRIFDKLNTRAKVLMATIFNAWPMLVFIIVSATLAGLVVWLLDKNKNSSEFPPTFFSGAWEGIWWAFVTMTTVGYGDRSPKSIYARAFCIVWILIGIILFSLFTGLVTTALSQSTTPVFRLPGAKIAAVRGSMEFQIAVELNAEVQGFDSHHLMLTDLVHNTVLEGAMIDNFMLSATLNLLQHNRLRMEREINQPVTYGIALSNNSTKTETCFRTYLRHHPNRIFEIINKNLKPIKNPTDNVRLEVEAAEKLFYQEDVFKKVVYYEIGLLVLALVIGVLWELFIRKKNGAVYKALVRLRRNPSFGRTEKLNIISMNSRHEENDVLELLIKEYETFHTTWIERMIEIKDRRYQILTSKPSV